MYTRVGGQIRLHTAPKRGSSAAWSAFVRLMCVRYISQVIVRVPLATLSWIGLSRATEFRVDVACKKSKRNRCGRTGQPRM